MLLYFLRFRILILLVPFNFGTLQFRSTLPKNISRVCFCEDHFSEGISKNRTLIPPQMIERIINWTPFTFVRPRTKIKRGPKYKGV